MTKRTHSQSHWQHAVPSAFERSSCLQMLKLCIPWRRVIAEHVLRQSAGHQATWQYLNELTDITNPKIVTELGSSQCVPSCDIRGTSQTLHALSIVSFLSHHPHEVSSTMKTPMRPCSLCLCSLRVTLTRILVQPASLSASNRLQGKLRSCRTYLNALSNSC